MPELFIPVILGTAREGRQSEKVAKFVFRQLQNFSEGEYQLIDVRDLVREPRTYAPWMQNSITSTWQEIAARADGFIFVVPEYNRGYPGELKLLIDQAQKEYEKKTIAMVGVSVGNFGGVRVIEHMQNIWNYLKMIPVPESLPISNVSEVFDEQGNLKDTSYTEKTNKFLQKMIEYTRDVKKMREQK